MFPVATTSQPNLFESAISRTPRMRAWRFSSVRSGSRPRNGSARVSRKPSTSGSIGSSRKSAPRRSASRRASPRVPSELNFDGIDEDSLPPYPELDRVLEAYVELDQSREDMTSDGFDPEVVDHALAMIDRAEYKRRQAPPGVKLRPKALQRLALADHECVARLKICFE